MTSKCLELVCFAALKPDDDAIGCQDVYSVSLNIWRFSKSSISLRIMATLNLKLWKADSVISKEKIRPSESCIWTRIMDSSVRLSELVEMLTSIRQLKFLMNGYFGEEFRRQPSIISRLDFAKKKKIEDLSWNASWNPDRDFPLTMADANKVIGKFRGKPEKWHETLNTAIYDHDGERLRLEITWEIRSSLLWWPLKVRNLLETTLEQSISGLFGYFLFNWRWA